VADLRDANTIDFFSSASLREHFKLPNTIKKRLFIECPNN